ncbi:DUF4257 domain-containing protein [Sutcliffiella cohnii]|uniref:DUF4257 domain-containing protein n=1 Tax=Sutcliffiella cohnii TaxID=33932 RepID=UPI000836D2D4|nr:DUF4257 domain-containing protein [Sutcliffiella cohnii]
MFFVKVLVSFLCGGVAGFGFHLITHKKHMDFPKKTVTGWYLGYLADVFIGGVAAIIAVTFLVPEAESWRTVVGVSFLAGVSGESILLRRSLDNERLKNQHLEDIDKRLKGDIDNDRE